MARNGYIPEMRVSRGIGIILVTLGHSEPIRSVFPLLFSVIYAFHMPLFFFLSGFFSLKDRQARSLSEWIRVTGRSLPGLIIPYICVSLLFSLLKYFVPHLAVRPVVPTRLFFDILVFPAQNPARFLWFLYVIIILRALTPLLAAANPYFIIAALLIPQVFEPDIPLFGTSLILHYGMFYCLGMLVSTVQEQFLALLKKQWLPPAALLFFAAGYILFVKTGWFLLPLSNALWGIIFTLSVCFCYSRFLPRKILETAGTYSFSLYLLQYFFIFPVYLLLARSISLPGPWIVPCTFAAGLAGPLFMIFYVFPHSRVLSLLLSGNEKMPARQQ